jgi:hypothetical protein
MSQAPEAFIVVRFTTLEYYKTVTRNTENGMPRRRNWAMDLLNKSRPPFIHADLIIPAPNPTAPHLLLPLARPDSWRRILVAEPRRNEPGGVGVLTFTPPPTLDDRCYLLLPCTRLQVACMWGFLEKIRSSPTTCSSTGYFLVSTYLKTTLLPASCLTCCCLKLPNNQKRNWHCSELVVYLLQKAGMLDEHIHPTLLVPSELFLLLYHNPARILQSPVPFFNRPAELIWEKYMQTPPPEITKENCTAIAVFSSYHDEAESDFKKPDI